jgi:hypothetical protein
VTPSTATSRAIPARSRGRPRTTTAETAADKRSSPNLADQVLALATGKTQQEIAAACKGLAPTMSAPRLPGTRGLAVSKSTTESSTADSQRRPSNAPGSETDRKRAAPRNSWLHDRREPARVVSGQCRLPQLPLFGTGYLPEPSLPAGDIPKRWLVPIFPNMATMVSASRVAVCSRPLSFWKRNRACIICGPITPSSGPL